MSPLRAQKTGRIVTIEVRRIMNFKKKYDLRVSLAKINFTLTLMLLVTIVFSFIYKKLSPFTNLLTALIPFDFFSSQKLCLMNSYLFLNYKGKEPSPTKDYPIKPQDIECYSLNNPFPAFSNLCYSGKNITLFLKNNKKITVSAKDQEIFLLNWLKENFIREENKISIMGNIETVICAIVTLLELLFFINLYKSGNMPKYGFHYFITSAVCFAYWVIYIISGIAIKAIVRIE